ncbi:hypothetical protein [Emticicia sp. TH156]|uniref:hypothetical protein n=1 Tax=Emticicia sp. TH156 TaxID=2067454 RepID=UPI000C7829C2|nr:hypothetical protein [Emticicia sp. TH156]PLK44497.1 hypothetical protein C0V77_11990 [Emticicia sp. TH156]
MSSTKLALGYVSTDETRPDVGGLYRVIVVEEGLKLLASQEEDDITLKILPQELGPEAAPTFSGLTITGNAVTGLNKGQVGLSNVDNTSDAAKPISVAQQAALSGKLSSVTVSTYAEMLALTVEVDTLVRVENDERKGIKSAIYIIYPNETLLWIAATEEM